MARVTVSGDQGVIGSALTNPFGYYTIFDVPTGHSYIITPSKKGTTFTPSYRFINLMDDFTDADFVGSTP